MHDSDALSRILARLDALLASAVQAAVATLGAGRSTSDQGSDTDWSLNADVRVVRSV